MELLSEIDNTGWAANAMAGLDTAARERSQLVLRNYADILYDFILNEVHHKKDYLLNKLRENIAEGTKGGVLLWSYRNTFHDRMLDSYEMSRLSEEGFHTVIFDGGVPMCVDRIVQNSDILWRLAFTFGSRFRVKRVYGAELHRSAERTTFEFELRLEFVPEGLNEFEEKKLIDAYKGVANRQMYSSGDAMMTARC